MYKLFSVDDHIIEPARRLVFPGAGEVPRRRSPRGRGGRPRVLGVRGPPQRHDGPQRGGRQAARGVEPRADALHRHDPRLLRPGGPRRGPAVAGDLRERELPDAAAVRRRAVPHVHRHGPRRRVRQGVERLHARRVVRRRSRHVRADDHLPAVGPRARGRRDPSLCRRRARRRCASSRTRARSACRRSITPTTGTRCSHACEEADIPVCMHIGSSGSGASGSALAIDPHTPTIVPIAYAFASAAAGVDQHDVEPDSAPVPRHQAGVVGGRYRLDSRRARTRRPSVGTASLVTRRRPAAVGVGAAQHVVLHDRGAGRALQYRHDFRVDHIVWESDYPHADTPFPNTQAIVKALFDGLPADEVELITHVTAEALFHHPLVSD